MVINDRNMQRVLTRLIKFVMVEGLRLSVLNVMYHNGMFIRKCSYGRCAYCCIKRCTSYQICYHT